MDRDNRGHGTHDAAPRNKDTRHSGPWIDGHLRGEGAQDGVEHVGTGAGGRGEAGPEGVMHDEE